MKLSTIAALACVPYFVPTTALAAQDDTVCGGTRTPIYSSKDMALVVCHAPYTKVSRSQLDRWQDCDDAMIQVTDKKTDRTTTYVDCAVAGRKQFMLRGNVLLLRHFLTEYPSFDMKPMLVERLDLVTRERKYEFTRKIPSVCKTEVGEAIRKIDSAKSKPDDKSYFTLVYGGFFQLRDCAAAEPGPVLAALRKYQDSGVFDGEVAETLSTVIDEAELISQAAR